MKKPSQAKPKKLGDCTPEEFIRHLESSLGYVVDRRVDSKLSDRFDSIVNAAAAQVRNDTFARAAAHDRESGAFAPTSEPMRVTRFDNTSGPMDTVTVTGRSKRVAGRSAEILHTVLMIRDRVCPPRPPKEAGVSGRPASDHVVDELRCCEMDQDETLKVLSEILGDL